MGFRIIIGASFQQLDLVAKQSQFLILVEKQKRKTVSADTRIAMTGKKAQAHSNREKVLHTLEKLEANLGVGSVTRAELKDACDEKGIDSQIIYQLVREGYIKGLS